MSERRPGQIGPAFLFLAADMIDTTRENLVPLRCVPGRLPKRPNGKRIHISAVYRWTDSGIRGVVLESIRVGGITFTSLEAIQRFAERLTKPQSLMSRRQATRERVATDQVVDRVAAELGIRNEARPR